ncbi:MAG: phosphopyruvate hydratase, partial [Candidatus Woesearchaeota archaeon]
MKIKKIKAREVLDSRGNPTIECVVYTDYGSYSSIVPSGASTGVHEALELRDNGKEFNGKGVKKAINNIENIIAPYLIDMDPAFQEEIDDTLLKLDGTDNKSELGANALLAVSLASARAGAASKRIPLYKHINNIYSRDYRNHIEMPHIFSNVINGGEHAGNGLDIQEFMITTSGKTVRERIRKTAEIYHILKNNIRKKYGKNSVNVGDEGGFAPPINTASQALDLLEESIKESGYDDTEIAIDAAASEFYEDGLYHLNNKSYTKDELISYYLELIEKYDRIISIEDPFDEDDFQAFQEFKKRTSIQVVGDDLLVTNPKRIKDAIDYKLCNALLLKVNQIGTLSE